MNKRVIAVVVGGILVAGAGFVGGYFLSSRASASKDPRAAFSRLSEADRQAMAGMSDTERQEFLRQKGIDVGAGRPGMGLAGDSSGPRAARGPGGTQVLEGTVASIDADKVSLTLAGGGSAKVYTDDSTVLAAVAGKTPELTEGAAVLMVVKNEAAGVTAASAVVVK